MRDKRCNKKKGFHMSHLLYVLLLEKLYISDRFIATKLSNCPWSRNLFVKYEFIELMRESILSCVSQR